MPFAHSCFGFKKLFNGNVFLSLIGREQTWNLSQVAQVTQIFLGWGKFFKN